MTTLIPLFLLLLTIQCASGSQELDAACPTTSCGGVEIKFPFGLKGPDQSSSRCSYPDFSVSCNNQSQTILSLPDSSGELLIKGIDYASQTLSVNDPSQCLPRQFLQDRLKLSSPPFILDLALYNFINLTFLRCPYNLTKNEFTSVHCLNDLANSSFAVMYLWSRSIPPLLNASCEVINSSVPYPISNIDSWPFWVGDDLMLTWGKPQCGRCEDRGQDCGFAGDLGNRTACFSRPHESSGIPRGIKYGLTIGVGVPGLLCLIGLSCFISKRLAKPNDNTCSICLSDYEPKEPAGVGSSGRDLSRLSRSLEFESLWMQKTPLGEVPAYAPDKTSIRIRQGKALMNWVQ